MDIAAELATVKAAVRETNAEPRSGWAWTAQAYRASPTRAFPAGTGALTVDDGGMQALEAAMNALMGDQRVREKWLDDDLWTVVLSLLAAAKDNDTIDLDAAVRMVIKPRPVRIFAALANVTWEAGPVTVGGLTIAHLQTDDDAASLAKTLSLDAQETEVLISHSQKQLKELGDYVVATAASARQGELAYEDFERCVEDLIGLTLMLSSRLGEHGIYSLRGESNRPGIRGATFDHGKLRDLIAQDGVGELRARILRITSWDAGEHFRWQSADPMQLDHLFDEELLPLLKDLLQAQDAIAQRLRVAARWYARAFWSHAEDDAALAVSVALDSMLTGKEAVPGAVSKGRFALLERVPSARSARFDRYEQVYQVRSAIAHGGDATRRLAKIGGARSILKDARWVAERLLDLRQISTPENDAAFRDLWAAVQWGSLPWAAPS
ncbi:hypothetical protein ACIP9X_13030 [Arthrobacter sp. NPDC093125]|uniref:hypothetical protein n=1 Tax=Arthrobacter sp. NPDC093125 TaxID=3363944 RepID=UPI0038022BAE